jgi:hypothetical protein
MHGPENIGGLSDTLTTFDSSMKSQYQHMKIYQSGFGPCKGQIRQATDICHGVCTNKNYNRGKSHNQDGMACRCDELKPDLDIKIERQSRGGLKAVLHAFEV